jgi:hypothetical protein
MLFKAIKKLIVAALTLCLGSIVMATASPEQTLVTVRGRVVDKNGLPISGAEVRIGRWGAYIGDKVDTDKDGMFAYPNILPLTGCVATGELSTELKNAYIARITVGGDVWPEIPLCVEPQGSVIVIDKGDLSRGHFWWANYFFHLVRNVWEDNLVKGDQEFFDTWQFGIGNDRGGPIDWQINVATPIPVVVPPGTQPDPDLPKFTWNGSLTANQDFNYTAVGLEDSQPFPTPQPLGFEVNRSWDGGVIGANATENRSFTLTVTTIDPQVRSLYGNVQPYNTPDGPVVVSDLFCHGNGTVNNQGDIAHWFVQAEEPGGHLSLGTYQLTCSMKLSNKGDTPAFFRPWATIQAMQEQYVSRFLGVSSLEVTSPDVKIEPRDHLGVSTFMVNEPSVNPGNGLFDVDFNRSLVRRIAFMSENVGISIATDPDQCKKGGWMFHVRADGTTFKNQGDCVSYMHNGK